MAGGAGADQPVVGILDEPAGVAGDRLDHAWHLPEHPLDAPEASGSERGDLVHGQDLLGWLGWASPWSQSGRDPLRAWFRSHKVTLRTAPATTALPEK